MRGRYLFKVRTYECGPDGFATLPTVCNMLQESASLNAESLGFSKSNFASANENVSWVLTRLVVRMHQYPKWEDTVVVETFPRGGRKIVAWRDFEIKDASGKSLGVASSEWMLIDLSTRKVVAIPDAVFAATDPADLPIMGELPFSKFKFPDPKDSLSFCQEMSFNAQKSHIDLNGHVNNVHYVEWMLEPCTNAHPPVMEIVFRSETFAGDEVRVACVMENSRMFHRVFAPNGQDHAIAWTEQRLE